MYAMNLLQTIEFDNSYRNKNISGTVYRSDLCLYAKRAGGRHLTAHIKQRPAAFLWTEISGEIKCRISFGTPCILQRNCFGLRGDGSTGPTEWV